MKTGFVSEIYCTLQGEGIYLGEPQVFVRLAGCPLRCVWCDTPKSLSVNGHAAMEVPEVIIQVRKAARQALPGNPLPPHPHPLPRRGEGINTVSLTGGEPLAQADFLSHLLPALKGDGWRTYLETAGVHPAALARVIDYCDVVSMDIKLPSAVGRTYWGEHAEFLKIGAGKTYVKIVVCENTQDDEMKTAIELLEKQTPLPSLVIQPVTPIAPLTVRFKDTAGNRPGEGLIRPPLPSKIQTWVDLAKTRLPDVRVMTQMHPVWGIP